jgi:hypothetical protein
MSSISTIDRRRLALRNGGSFGQVTEAFCYYCEALGYIHWTLSRYYPVFINLEMDHFIPKALGGSDDWSNLELVCPPCNRSKGARIMYAPFLNIAEDLHKTLHHARCLARQNGYLVEWGDHLPCERPTYIRIRPGSAEQAFSLRDLMTEASDRTEAELKAEGYRV